ncbi:tetraspanin-1-like [Lethenteron reissneri]|uniref:tetraspanin-1-like n=1 Tax=Lethenteron reissneri TaxID=7753 RepID=UPI002AB6CF4E|nr:tetraspanin-1-like [Lethenteron reissneri]
MSCYKFLRGMMIFFNVIVFLGGSLLLGAGVWIKVDGSSFTRILGPDLAVHFVNVGYFCIAAGGLLILLGFLGCAAACKESKCMLMTFFTIVLIIFIAEVAAGISALLYGSLVASLLQGQAVKSIKEDYGQPGPKQVVTDAWNAIMQKFQCCGFTNYTDFDGSKFSPGYNLYPTLCCPSYNLTLSPTAASTIFSTASNSTSFNATSSSPASTSSSSPTTSSSATTLNSTLAGTFNSTSSVPSSANTTFSSSSSTSGTCSNPYRTGCYDQLKYLFEKNAYIIGGIAAGTCGLELAAMIVALILYCQVDKH